jgi:excisionase family DNA binding protein
VKKLEKPTSARQSVTVTICWCDARYALFPMPELDAERFPPILTTAMAAELLHVHVEYLRRMVREGRIPAHRFPGGREIRFHRDELIEWVRDQPGYNRSPSVEDRVAQD